MTEKDLTTVDNSISFRDVVMDMDRKGQKVYARKHGSSSPTYEIMPRHVDAFQQITFYDLFGSPWPPVYMNDFAQALPSSSDPAFSVDVFTL